MRQEQYQHDQHYQAETTTTVVADSRAHAIDNPVGRAELTIHADTAGDIITIHPPRCFGPPRGITLERQLGSPLLALLPFTEKVHERGLSCLQTQFHESLLSTMNM